MLAFCQIEIRPLVIKLTPVKNKGGHWRFGGDGFTLVPSRKAAGNCMARASVGAVPAIYIDAAALLA